MGASTGLADLLAVDKTGPFSFRSKNLPVMAGNNGSISFGGFTVGVALNAASQTVPPEHSIYSVVGNFLAAASTKTRLTCSIENVRDTKSFSTRQVKLFQEQANGTNRLCLLLIMDSRRKESAMMTFSPQPSRQYSSVRDCAGLEEIKDRLIAEGSLSKHDGEIFNGLFKSIFNYFDVRHCPEGVGGQNLLGMAKTVQTTQEELPLTERTSAEWLRSRHQLNTVADHVSSVSYIMDGALSFIPLTHNHLFLDDAGACSSLDFALRFFDTEVNLNQWHLRELKTICGAEGLTYSESRLWNSGGRLVASMTQQSILRPKQSEIARL